ncbi:hypothetical protein E2C01_032866 [Portunus trituberculatus]|uniref:Uncharacterized protein n=1 Tax=Portunus trituberculatus TaxID=210409 RepID=A0A5B7F2M4_PORTR|nr:hypothetical protein [Portunus trituberculatus]
MKEKEELEKEEEEIEIEMDEYYVEKKEEEIEMEKEELRGGKEKKGRGDGGGGGGSGGESDTLPSPAFQHATQDVQRVMTTFSVAKVWFAVLLCCHVLLLARMTLFRVLGV